MKPLQLLRNRKLPYQTSTTTAPYLFSNSGNEITLQLCRKADPAKLETWLQGNPVQPDLHFRTQPVSGMKRSSGHHHHHHHHHMFTLLV